MSDDRRLADFQRLMRAWKELAPYNAAHVLQISDSTLSDASRTNLTGLTGQLHRWQEALDRARKGIVSGDELLHVEPGGSDLERTVERELNRPFAPMELPFRAIVIPADRSHFLLLTYDHWFADSPSMRALLHRAFARYCGTRAELPPLRRAARLRCGSGLSAIAHGVRTYRRHRRAARVHLHNCLDFRTGFLLRYFAPGTISGIRRRAREQGAKVNDVFIAAAAHVLGSHTAAQRAHSKRNQVAIASAVDLRDAEADATFGFDVTYFSVVVANPEQTRFDDLVRTVAQQTSAMKTAEQIARFNLSLKCARFAWSLTSKPKRRAELFRKGLPLVAGISNVNLSQTWVADAGSATREPRLLDYLRVSPVGPLLPLVFTLTTIGERLSLCVSFRTTAFPNHIAAHLADAFMSKLIAFSKTTI